MASDDGRELAGIADLRLDVCVRIQLPERGRFSSDFRQTRLRSKARIHADDGDIVTCAARMNGVGRVEEVTNAHVRLDGTLFDAIPPVA